MTDSRWKGTIFEKLVQKREEEDEQRRIRNAAEGPVAPVLFGMDDEESRRYRRWYDEHHKTCVYINYELAHERGGGSAAIGGCITFQFTPTGIGTVCSVRCACGVKIDCTDYDNW